MANGERDPNEIGALWTKTSKKKGTEYMSGVIAGQNVVCFRNKDKKTDKHPDWRVLKSVPKSEAPPPDDQSGF